MQEPVVRTLSIEVPAFVDEVVARERASLLAGGFAGHEARVRLTLRLAEANVAQGGGPFGAAVFAGDQLLAAGVNCVLSSGLSIAHAEIVAIMRAQSVLRALGQQPSAELSLVSSAEPCCQCFGALIWSGVSELVYAASRADVEAIGFDEGPKPERWVQTLRAKGIAVVEELCRDEAGHALAEYARRGGPIYGLRHPGVTR
jgi:tRNA(Arg) A34 adenosine deaminase TadA